MSSIYLIVILSVIGVALLISFISLIKSRLAVEKMVSLDVITTIITALLMVLSIILESSFVLDIAIIYAILSFGAVLVIARYREGGF
jgi:multicomponent Na+:H+ antiporter subunit F